MVSTGNMLNHSSQDHPVEYLEPKAVARMSLIVVHLFAFCAAGAAVAFCDFAIFARRRLNRALLTRALGVVGVTLVLLWLSGLSIIWLDTSFSFELLLAQPKLQAKLTVVSLLTLNGFALHGIVFRRLMRPDGETARTGLLPTVLGAVSAATWLFAAFLGVCKPLVPALGYPGLMLLYAAALSLALLVALGIVRPRLIANLGRPGTFSGARPERRPLST